MTALPLHGPESRDYLAAIRAAIRPEFLEEAGWDETTQILSPPRDHPLLGLRKCRTNGCLAGVRSPYVELCITCEQNHRASGLPFEEFILLPAKKRNRGERFCKVPDCERPEHVSPGLCSTHYTSWRGHPIDDVAAWIAEVKPVGLPSHGDCVVASCIRAAAYRSGLCSPHRQRWRAFQRTQGAPDTDDARTHWALIAEPIGIDHIVTLRGLDEQVILEILLALQRRTDDQVRTLVTVLRHVVKMARSHQARSLSDLLEVKIDRSRHDVSSMIKAMTTEVRRALSTPASEHHEDEWDLTVFGVRGYLRFTRLHQPWLREAAKHWSAEDLPLHRGRQRGATAKGMVSALNYFSESLRATREDQGNDVAALGRKDVVNFLNRVAHLESTDELTAHMRLRTVRYVRRFLDDIRSLGLTRGDGVLAGLGPDVVVRKSDVPPEPQSEGPGRDLPDSVIRAIAENLDVLEERSGRDPRVMVEVMIDTGRRPDEVCRLRWGCLDKDPNGKYVLIYDDSKTNKPGRRLPIGKDTADKIRAHRKEVRERFPGTRTSALMLFPRDYKNPTGTSPITEASFGDSHRRYINAIAVRLVDTDGDPFPAEAVVPYSYRHSYAQRHADAGTQPDVLRDLMGHKSMQTTLGYYRVTEQRVRKAVDQVAQHQFDGQGRPIIARVAGLLADEHARLRVGQVAVPFGICTEPSNVKAGGAACPFKYTCVGCGHFRSDASYLPELKSYLQQLLADRERLMAATDVQDWARQKAMPADQEITQVRDLIRRIESDLDSLSVEDKETIEHAVSVIRSARQSVNIGMPTIRSQS